MKKLYGRYTFHKILHLKLSQWIRKTASASMRVFVYTLTHCLCVYPYTYMNLFPDYRRIGRTVL